MPKSFDESAILYALLDSAVDAMIIADVDGKIIRTNHSACKVFGHDSKDLVGQNLTILMPKIWADQHDAFIRNYRRSGIKRIIGIGRDVTGLRKDGSEVPLRLSVGEGNQNGQTFFVGILHDLTSRRASERALERSQRMDAIGRLTGGVSHDFNNLLTIIIGNLELLEARLADTPDADLLRDALEAAESGSNLIRQLLVFSRRGELSPNPLAPSKAVSEALGLLRRTISPRIEIETKLAKDLPLIAADPSQLQSALMNLAINARDAMPEGGRLIFETSRVQIDDTYIAQETDIEFGDYICISISDNGVGMSAETQKRAFEPFYTTKPSGEGTGLGLSTLYGFVKQSGGYVTIYSERDYGTTIGMYFPVLGDAETIPAKSKGQVASQRDQGAGKTILLVEDDPAVLRLTENRLAALGYTIITAETADDAYDLLDRGTKADLLLTDLIMPGRLTGHDLARIVRARWPAVHVLLSSGYSEEMARKTDLAQSGFPLLRKPYRQADLALQLAKIFSSQAS